ncbi:MAG: sulfotransferase [Planctomycetota bacterium]|jgi:hypothetical protein
MRLAFVTSTGRTGTAFLTRLFNEGVPGAFSLHEPRPAFRRRARSWMGRPATWLERRRFKATREGFCAGRPESLYVENNFQLFAAMPLIRETFPDAAVIHIIRDGRPVTTSYLNRYRYIRSDHITPADIPGDPAAEQWEGWSPVQKLAWYWSTVNRHVVAQGPDLVVRFEDMFDEHRSGLWRMLDFLEVEYDREVVEGLAGTRVNVNRAEFFPSYDEWPRLWKEQFREVAGDAMSEFGYAIES